MDGHFVYIIKSQSTGHHYIGETSDITDRLNRHNSNRSKSTKGKGPWEIEALYEVKDKSEACLLELKLKGMKNSLKAVEYLKRLNSGAEHSDF